MRRDIKAYYHTFLSGPPEVARLLIFAQGRTGRTLLESPLASTGHFEERGEVLGANNERVALATRRDLDQQEAEVLRDIPYLSLVYEDDLKDPEKQVGTIAKVLDFLDLEKRPAKTRMKKTNVLPQEQIFTNFTDAFEWTKVINEDA